MTVGTCNCGAVEFEIDIDLKDVYVCHCSICRRWSGHSGIGVVIVPNAAFRWLSGSDEIKTWSKPDADWQSHFCTTCGSAVPGANDPEHMFVPAGLLGAEIDTLKVKAHIFVGSKACWDEIGDEGAQHAGHIKT